MKLIQDDKGQDSSIRAGFLFLLAVITGTWSWVSISNGQLQHVDPETVALVLGGFGAKVWQKNVENGNSKESK